MTEHGWPEHHDDVPDLDPAGDLHPPPDDPQLDAAPHDDLDLDDEPGGWGAAEPAHLPVEHHDPAPEPFRPDDAGPAPDDTPPGGPVGADPDALPETDDPPGGFPPAVDVGALPEPVDGFPWIDTGSLGVADIAAAGAAGAPTAQDLAAYAAADLPPGADPWAVLADSDDPATAALARFYRPGDTGPDA